MTQLKRALIGGGVGAGLGYAYFALMPCMGGACALDSVAGVPMLAGAFFGVMLVLSSRWD